MVATGGHLDVGEVDVHVAHAPTAIAHQVVVRLECGIEPAEPVPRSIGAISPMDARSFSVWYTVRSEMVGISVRTVA